MPDVRTTRVALLVDREVDRDVQTSRIALLVDRETDVTLVTEASYAVADIEHAVDLVVEGVYLVADIEDGYPWGDIFDQTSDFTFTLVTSGTNRDWEDIDAWEDLFSRELAQPENWIDEHVQADQFDLIYVFQDTWNQQDTHRALRSDLEQLYQDIVSYINTYGLSTPVPPGPAAYDIDDNGRIQLSDALTVYTWWLHGVLVKNLRTTDSWFVHYHNWPNISRDWQDNFPQTQLFTVEQAYLTFTAQQIQTDSWFNPGNVLATQLNVQTQTDTFNIFSDQQRWQDIQTHYATWDPSFPAKVRAWSDIQNQTDRWDNTNLADYWEQTDLFQLGVTQAAIVQTWVQTSIFKPPHALAVAQTWTQTDVYDCRSISRHFEDSWTLTQNLHAPTQYAQWSDVWIQTDTIRLLTPEILSETWDQQSEFRPTIILMDISDTWEQISKHHSMTQDVYINQKALVLPYYAMLNWFLYELHAVRQIHDTINWSERWNIVLPTEDLTTTQTSTDEFEANPLWEDLVDIQNQQETWHQLSGTFYDDIFYQTSFFLREHHARRLWEITWTADDTFNCTGASGTTGWVISDTDIEAGDETLDVAYSEGIIAVGTKYIIDGVDDVFVVLATTETGGNTTSITFRPALRAGSLPAFNAKALSICPEIPEGLFTLIDSNGSLELRNAHWGDTATLETFRTVGITRNGTPFVERRTNWPQREVFKYTIRALSDDQLDDILSFLDRNIGKLIQWIDHYDEHHAGFCLEPATPAIRRSKDRGSIELTLVALDPATILG